MLKKYFFKWSISEIGSKVVSIAELKRVFLNRLTEVSLSLYRRVVRRRAEGSGSYHKRDEGMLSPYRRVEWSLSFSLDEVKGCYKNELWGGCFPFPI